tara:strand:+ start:165 stop:452 length:288 start_codon:yes stop_codon:yes gene_type:complete
LGNNEKFLGHIDEELERLKKELDQVKDDIESAQQITVKKKELQDKLKQELIAVDSMKRAYGQLSQEAEEPSTKVEEDLQQPPEGYDEEQDNEGQQ